MNELDCEMLANVIRIIIQTCTRLIKFNLSTPIHFIKETTPVWPLSSTICYRNPTCTQTKKTFHPKTLMTHSNQYHIDSHLVFNIEED